jgi:hypothetical protein
MTIKPQTYLRTEIVKPGDVILSRSSGKESKIIAKFTRGRYSHAALVCNPSVRFESLSDGIGFTWSDISRAEYHEDEGFWLLEDISHYSDIAVYRYPNLSKEKEDAVKATLLKLVDTFYGLEYPDLTHLADASSPSPTLRRLAAVLLRYFGKKTQKTPIIPGPFCSELVALVFDSLGLPLFDSNRPAKTISPNDLSRSRLRLVPNAICCSAGEIENNEKLVRELNSTHKGIGREILPILVKGKRVLKEAEEFNRVLDIISDNLRKIFKI